MLCPLKLPALIILSSVTLELEPSYCAHLKMSPLHLPAYLTPKSWSLISLAITYHIHSRVHAKKWALSTDNPCCSQWPDINLIKMVIPSCPFLAQKRPRAPQPELSFITLDRMDRPKSTFSYHSFVAWTYCFGKSELHRALAVPLHCPFLSILILLSSSMEQPRGLGYCNNAIMAIVLFLTTCLLN